MKLKLELKKFLISSLFVTLDSFYYNTSQFRYSLLDGLKTTVFGMFEDVTSILIGIGFYLAGYLLFNLIYFIIYAIFKFFKLQKNVLSITSLSILIFMSINVLNDQLIFSDLKEYGIHSYFKPVATNGDKIDSTNFKEYVWERKQTTISSPVFILTEKIIFNDDSTFTLIGDRIKFGKLYLIRKFFDDRTKYRIRTTYEYKDISTSVSVFDSTTAYPLQIRNNKLYLNTTFF